MQFHDFDDRNIPWRRLDWLEHVSFYVYDIDEENRIVDVIFKFAAHKQAMLHQHKAPYITLVIQGELRLFHADGELKEVRPIGSYVSSPANGEPHREGGGDQDAIVFFSNRNVEGPMYEFLDNEFKPVLTLGFTDFKAQLDAQRA